MRARPSIDMALENAMAVILAVLEGRDFSCFKPRDPVCARGWRAWGYLAATGEW